MSAPGPTVRIVAQHVLTASLLIDNVAETVTARAGVVLYVAFLGGAAAPAVDAAIKALLTTKVFALHNPTSPVAAAADGEPVARPKPVAVAESDCDVLVVPQATLAGRPKGKVVQYHAQVAKDEGAVLYKQLCDGLRAAVSGAAPCDANGRPAEGATGRVVLCGTYGNRQALQTDCHAPMTHLFEF
jgi:D-Tyr-tRNAtyr deacylase